MTDDERTADLADLLANWPMGAQFDLPPNATVVVAGAYKGRVMDFMLEHYPQIGRIIGFEPQTWAWAEACQRMTRWSTRLPIEIHNLGLWTGRTLRDEPEQRQMGEFGTDGCSLVRLGQREQGTGWFRNADVMLCYAVDLFIMNLEGYERELLPYIAQRVPLVNTFAVQFHEGETGDYREVIKKCYDYIHVRGDATWSILRRNPEADE